MKGRKAINKIITGIAIEVAVCTILMPKPQVKASNLELGKSIYSATNYKIDEQNKTITKIPEKTSAEKILNLIDSSYEAKIIKQNGENVAENEYVGTGMKLKVEGEEYTLGVEGDVTGDRKSNRHRLNKNKKTHSRIRANSRNSPTWWRYK